MPKQVSYLQGLPYVQDIADSIDLKQYSQKILAQLEPYKENACAIILEPLLQGAGGMKVYSPKILKVICNWAKKNEVFVILDEIMTGFWKTGKCFAYEHADIQADFLCLSKGLTAGTLPLSTTLITEEVYQLFYGKYGADSSFYTLILFVEML